MTMVIGTYGAECWKQQAGIGSLTEHHFYASSYQTQQQALLNYSLEHGSSYMATNTESSQPFPYCLTKTYP